MSVKTLQSEKNLIYFCTFTCYNWLKLFEITNYYTNIYKWFDILENYGNKLIGYVIMPDHIHFLLFLHEKNKIINNLISNGKRFMAYDIVKILKNQNNCSIINILKDGVSENEMGKGKNHQVFEPSFDAKICWSEEVIVQKLDYIHHNPVFGIWNLVGDFTEYIHSSAKYYETGVQGIYPVMHYKDAFESFFNPQSPLRETLRGSSKGISSKTV